VTERGTREDLLDGPRGRRLCWIAVEQHAYARTGRGPFWDVISEPEPMLTELRRVLRTTDLAEFSTITDDVALLNFVGESVATARYWQDPDEEDRALCHPDFITELQPVADAIAAAPASAWWPSDLALGDQVYADWREDGAPPPGLSGAQVILREWRRTAVNSMGMWWSPPIWAPALDQAARMQIPRPMLAQTTRRLRKLGAVGLLLHEDTDGTANALCRPVRARESLRTFEIKSTKDWIELVEHYPLDVTLSREGSWSAATGLERRWIVPDWCRVAEDYEAVHLTVSGYLSISGRSLLLGADTATLVAGWDPDQTYWLADVLELTGEPTPWEAGDPPKDWRVVADDES
jgi:hypothetical protein